jgi:hypothetical protein
MRMISRLAVAVAGALSLATVGAGAAQASTSHAAAPASAHASTVRPMTATECGSAPGPGNINTICVTVHGEGIYADKVIIDYSSTDYPYFPQTVCGVTFHGFGIYINGAPFNEWGTIPGCFDGAAEWTFYPNPAGFRANTLVCGTVSWGGQTSDPNCVKITN